jgi:hypothetical protein
MTNSSRGRPKASSKEARIKKMVQKLLDDYSVGERARDSGDSLETIAADHGLAVVTVRKLKLFAQKYSRRELRTLCALRRTGSGLPLHFGYVIYLLMAQSAAERRSLAEMEANFRQGIGRVNSAKAARDANRVREKFALKAAKNGWTAPELYSAVVAEYGLKDGHHGREKVLPQDRLTASVLATGEIKKWCDRLITLLSSPNDLQLPTSASSDLNSQLDDILRKIRRMKSVLK